MEVINFLKRQMDKFKKNKFKILGSEASRGFTLIEILIASSIFVIFLVGILGAFIQAIRINRVAMEMMSINDNMSVALEQIAREMRTGYNFCTGNQILTVATAQVQSMCANLDKNDDNREIQFVNYRNETVRFRINKMVNDSGLERGIDMLAGGDIYDSATCAAASGVVSTDGQFCYQKITSSNVFINYLRINLQYNNNISAGGGDEYPPRITLGIGFSGSDIDIKNMEIKTGMQTTISARNI